MQRVEREVVDEDEQPIVADDGRLAAVAEALALVSDNGRFTEHVATKMAELATITKRRKAISVKMDEIKASRDAALAANSEQQDQLSRRRGAVFGKEQELLPRRQRITALVETWRRFGESDDVGRGFRSATLSPLEKARRAFGMPAEREYIYEQSPAHAIEASHGPSRRAPPKTMRRFVP